MPDRGKIDRAVFEQFVAPNLGADRADVALGPTHGVDFGVLDVGGEALVLATDPISVLPDLGFERAGRFATDVVLADVAVSGVRPSHLAVSLGLPPSLSDADFAALWLGVSDRAREIGASIATGHTARYEGIDFPWVGAATVLGVGDHEAVVRPDGARPGDRIVLGTGPGAETAGLFSHLFPGALDLPAETVATAQRRLDETAIVEDAMAAAAAGEVTAMHDVTEGGLTGALFEMADSAGVGFAVERDRVPVGPGVEAVCEAAGVDPWHVTACGSLLATVAPDDADAVVAALENRGTRAAVIGEVVEGAGVTVDGEPVTDPGADPSWDAYERLRRRSER